MTPYREVPLTAPPGRALRFEATRQPARSILWTFITAGIILNGVALLVGNWRLVPMSTAFFFLPATAIVIARVRTRLYDYDDGRTVIEQRRGPFTRRIDLAEAQHVILCSSAIDPFLELTRLSTEDLHLWSIHGTRINVHLEDLSAELRREVGTKALEAAVARAETTLAADGTYIGPDRLHALSNKHIEGYTVGLTRKKVSAGLANIDVVTRSGVVKRRNAKDRSFFIGPFDMVLSELLRRRGLARQT